MGDLVPLSYLKEISSTYIFLYSSLLIPILVFISQTSFTPPARKEKSKQSAMGSLALIGRDFTLLSFTGPGREVLAGEKSLPREPEQAGMSDLPGPLMAAALRRMFWMQGRVVHLKTVPGNAGTAAETDIN